MGDEWDDDEWDVDDSQLDSLNAQEDEEEEDLAVKEAELAKKLEAVELKKKGNARLQKEEEAKTKALEAKAAKKALALEAELEANMSPTERARLEEERAADDAMEAFGGPTVGNLGADKYAGAGDKVVLKDLKDHLKHAAKVGDAVKKHGKTHLALTFLKELLQECKDVLDEDSIGEIIKSCNVIKNEKQTAAKKKVKGQAQKSKKVDKKKEAEAKKKAVDLYGDNDRYDEYDDYGAGYEDAFF